MKEIKFKEFDFNNSLVNKVKFEPMQINKRELEIENIIKNNLNKIEKGMKLIKNQFAIDGGIIDILARDKNDTLCIIELKVISNPKDIVFQCVYYPLAFNEKVRMITLCPNYIKPIYKCLKKLNVEMKKYYLDNKNNLIISDF